MAITAILFDLDNTLTDFMRMKMMAIRDAAGAMMGFGAEFGSDNLDEVSRELFDHYLDHGIESNDAFSRFIKRHMPTLVNDEIEPLAAAGVAAYLKAKNGLLTPYPGVIPTLVELLKRGIKLAVVTDAPRFKAWQRLHHLGIAEFFDHVVTSCDSGCTKPAVEPFKRALDALGVTKNEALMVGDWPERDVAGAKAAGIRAIHAAYGAFHEVESHGANYEIHNMKELIGIIDAINREE